MTVKENGEIQDRIRGCMFGGAVGDALGYPVEFLVEEEIFSQYGTGGIRAYETDKKSGKALISDDTQMTLFTANGLLVGDTRGKLQGIAVLTDLPCPGDSIEKGYGRRAAPLRAMAADIPHIVGIQQLKWKFGCPGGVKFKA